MPKALGLMNPENAAKSAGAFKEGFVRIDSNSYKVHQGKAGEGEPPVPATKWCWSVTRLQEDGSSPLLDEHDEPITEELVFSFGGKCLPFVHPGKADSVDDEEVEDLGTSVGAEGNTIFLNAGDWRPNEKSSLMVLTKSLVAQGVKPDYLNRCWADDWNGCVFELKPQAGEKGNDGRSFNYKIVARVLVGPGGKKGGATKDAAKSGDAEGYLAPILHKLSKELEGQQLTRKAFLNRVRGALDAAHTEARLLVPVLNLCKDDKWLEAHATTFDYTLDKEDNSITFGTMVPA